MSKFLNTQGLSEWMARIVDETKRELVIISPYLQLSDRIFQKLLNADKRGVEIVLIYRTLDKNKFLRRSSFDDFVKEKGKLDYEIGKLKAIRNLNLMHHPNIHAKCMYNENYLLIGSMNLYAYSEKNNREMGVLFHRENLPEFGDHTFGNADGESVFAEALEEILEIKNGAEMERASKETIEEGFELDILKNEHEKREEYVKMMNTVFMHKKFIVASDNGYLCKSYMDKVDVLLHTRTEFSMKFEAAKRNYLFNIYKPKKKDLEFSIPGFKMYWNQPDCILLYDDSRHHLWKKINTDIEELELRKKGIDEMILFIKQL
ncbi:MAG TPA: phospholipase D family protein [Flavobacterium sp.]|uniref:phospholipase D family protein n=1 Tax=Flavobacterium sp. TaxID=239 RepID=UPI002C497B62|nr:phospholipase D family protein [Flavobacterium sp.]HSD15580.1 phospholipase D family protein [Flavobacterium sp.]